MGTVDTKPEVIRKKENAAWTREKSMESESKSDGKKSIEQEGGRDEKREKSRAQERTAAIAESPEELEIHIGISEKDRKKIAEGLSRLLADSYTLYLLTHNFHWNVTGPMFRTLHLMFEQQYKEMAEAIDEIAERIRALGFPAPATYGEFSTMTSIVEEAGVPSAERMIVLLCEGQETVVRTAREMLPLVDRCNDLPTADLLTRRMNVHEKTAWMLRSLLMKKEIPALQ